VAVLVVVVVEQLVTLRLHFLVGDYEFGQKWKEEEKRERRRSHWWESKWRRIHRRKRRERQ
jgi:hypothetical protein